MPRFVSAFLLLLAGLRSPATAAPADGLPARPVPFTFVTDQGHLLTAADAKRLDAGLRRYADATGTQVVVVTVPSLNGADAADYGRRLGTAWGVGQRGKNNGLVVLLSAQEHKVSIEAGSGLKDVITPELTSRVINQQMTPAFRQGNYLGGLRTGLSTLMLAANPSSAPRPNRPAAATAPAATSAAPGPTSLADQAPAPGPDESGGVRPAATPDSSGPGLGTLLIGALVLGGGIWLVMRFLRRGNSSPAAASPAPDFLGNQPGGLGAPGAGYGQPGYGAAPGSTGGSGVGGLLATGAAAAAGAYLGNRLAGGGHDDAGNVAHNFSQGSVGGGGPTPAPGAADDYFTSRSDAADTGPAPDYFADDASANSSGDYFSTDDSSYDNPSSDDTGGGGFDGDGSQGSW